MQMLRTLAMVAAVAVLAGGCQSASGDDASTTTTFAPMSTTTTASEPTTTEAQPSTTASTTATTAVTTTIPKLECAVREIGTDDDFYRTTCEQNGISIAAAESVAAGALEAAADRMDALLAARPEVAAAVAASIDQVSIIGRDQRITVLPEFEDLYSIHPGTDWNRLGRSFPGTNEIPIAAGAEENLLCLESDRYEGEDMFIRDFGWTIRRFGIAPVDPGLDRSIEDAYIRAIAADLWQNTVAEVNSDQYWAEGVQSFFDANNEEKDEKDQVHNQVDTREELRAYDPFLYALLVDVFGETEWRPECGSDA
jgi:alpha-glucosidase